MSAPHQLTDGRGSYLSVDMEAPSIVPPVALSSDQDNRIAATVAPRGRPDTSISYGMPWTGEQHYFTDPPHNMNPYMYPANSTPSGTQHATADAYLVTSSSPTIDSALSSSTVHQMALCPTITSPAQSTNAPISSPLSAVSYFSGEGFVPREVWTGTEMIDPECRRDRAFPPPSADNQAAAPGAMAMSAPPRLRRSWSQISDEGPAPSMLTTPRRTTNQKSPKLSRSMPPRRQHEDEPVCVGVSGDDDGCQGPEALREARLARTHNLVEKHYRSRLNAQFERLLAVLPAKSDSQEEEWQHRGDNVPDKTISKAEILGMATQRIKILEQQNLDLLRRQDELIWNIEASGGNAAAPFMNSVLRQPPY